MSMRCFWNSFASFPALAFSASRSTTPSSKVRGGRSGSTFGATHDSNDARATVQSGVIVPGQFESPKAILGPTMEEFMCTNSGVAPATVIGESSPLLATGHDLTGKASEG